MDEAQLQTLAALAQELPQSDVSRLSDAAAGGVPALEALRSNSASDRLRSACQTLTSAIVGGANPAVLSGALLGASAASRRLRSTFSVDVVWTGPTSDVTTGRLTAAVISEILDKAVSEILLIGYAVHNDAMVAEGLAQAAHRNVAITLLLERSLDNPNYHEGAEAFPGLHARRLAWPAAQRAANGAALHAKILVVDRRIALVTTANITRWALERNLECGLLVRGGHQPKSIHDHIESLVAMGVLVRA
jgi:cardiolipin synthase